MKKLIILGILYVVSVILFFLGYILSDSVTKAYLLGIGSVGIASATLIFFFGIWGYLE